jgi:hypothetical protein
VVTSGFFKTADAERGSRDDLGRVSWSFTVPDDVTPGRATLVADGGESLPIQVSDR